MPASVTFSADMESRVRFVEDTPPEDIVEAAWRKLRDGDPPKAMLTAAVLAVSRSTELPSNHHGGPVHPVSGAHAIAGISARLTDDFRLLPIVQSVALANKHVHSPSMGPALMVDIEPLAAGDGSAAATADAFKAAIVERQPLTAEAHLLWLLQEIPPHEILDLMLDVAIRRNALDDHYFLYPVFTARALDDLGWEWAPVLLRPPVRYLARHPIMDAVFPFSPEYIARNLVQYEGFSAIEALIDEHDLLRTGVPQTGGGETAAIGDLSDRIGALDDFSKIPPLLAAALAGGLSLAGAGEAMSVGAALLFLRSDSGNPFDIHNHTGINVRRYLLGLEGISLRNKLLALFSWGTGPEVRDSQRKLRWTSRSGAETIAALPHRGQEELLGVIAEQIAAPPPFDMTGEDVHVNEIYVSDEVRDMLSLAQQYAESDYDPEAFFRRMADLACRDDYSEMHAYKLQQAAHEEYRATRREFRWVHLVSAARHAASVVRLEPKPVYWRSEELMEMADA